MEKYTVEEVPSKSGGSGLRLVRDTDQETVWIDHAQVMQRADVPITLLALFSLIPYEKNDTPYSKEMFRCLMTQTTAKRLVDLLSEQMDYYPEKPETEDND